MNIMSFTFTIRPVALKKGFELACDGVFPETVRHRRLIDAVIHAVQVGHQLDGEIRVFDCDGKVAEVLPVRWEEKRRRRPERLAA
jgi:hypothetical protein